MKAIIHYDDENSLRLALNGGKYHGCLWDLDQRMRNIIKHGDKNFECPEDVCSYVRDFINERIDMYEIE